MAAKDWTSALTLEQSAKTLQDLTTYAGDLMRPTVRVGVTGLARSGKTIFITSLIHNLVHHGRLPFFSAAAQGRIERVYLEPQPDDDVPRFGYEQHLADLSSENPIWPESTRRISQLRLTIEYSSNEFLKRQFGQNILSIDIVDYPGEWILDLPLLSLSFAEWSEQSLDLARSAERNSLSSDYLRYLHELPPEVADHEMAAQAGARLFTDYLKRCQEDDLSFSTVPPGRFLMPGDMEGSPALTFCPLPADHEGAGGVAFFDFLERRFEAYKTHVIKPFFHNHFSKIDRQIVLVDALQALNSGPAALRDLERALSDVLRCFRPGRNSWLTSILGKRIDRILFAATKADHLHHKAHDRLESILQALTSDAIKRAEFSGAEVDVLAMAALRATREAEAEHDGAGLPCILGYPLSGETLGKQVFDGSEEIAIFPGDLPEDPKVAIAEGRGVAEPFEEEMRFIRFRPPVVTRSQEGSVEEGRSVSPVISAPLPHIRLDRAIDFLIGDKLA